MDYNHHLLHSYNQGFLCMGGRFRNSIAACQLGSASESSPMLQDKMLDGKPGCKATGTPSLSSHCVPHVPTSESAPESANPASLASF